MKDRTAETVDFILAEKAMLSAMEERTDALRRIGEYEDAVDVEREKTERVSQIMDSVITGLQGTAEPATPGRTWEMARSYREGTISMIQREGYSMVRGETGTFALTNQDGEEVYG